MSATHDLWRQRLLQGLAEYTVPREDLKLLLNDPTWVEYAGRMEGERDKALKKAADACSAAEARNEAVREARGCADRLQERVRELLEDRKELAARNEVVEERADHWEKECKLARQYDGAEAYEAQIERLTASHEREVALLEKERDARLSLAVCAWCGTETAREPEAMVAHQQSCEKRNEGMEAQLRQYEYALHRIVTWGPDEDAAFGMSECAREALK